MEKAAINTDNITSTAIAFTIAPRINAAGRFGSPTTALQMLVSEDENTAELASELVRRTDLVRFGKFTSGKNWEWKDGVRLGHDVDAKYNMFPIPDSEITNNPDLKQNDGY